MPTLETLSIDLPAEMAATIRHAVQTGEYASQSDAIQEAVLVWSLERGSPAVRSVETMRSLWLEAIANEGPGLDPEAVFDELEAKYQALAEAEQR